MDNKRWRIGTILQAIYQPPPDTLSLPSLTLILWFLSYGLHQWSPMPPTFWWGTASGKSEAWKIITRREAVNLLPGFCWLAFYLGQRSVLPSRWSLEADARYSTGRGWMGQRGVGVCSSWHCQRSFQGGEFLAYLTSMKECAIEGNKGWGKSILGRGTSVLRTSRPFPWSLVLYSVARHS